MRNPSHCRPVRANPSRRRESVTPAGLIVAARLPAAPGLSSRGTQRPSGQSPGSRRGNLEQAGPRCVRDCFDVARIATTTASIGLAPAGRTRTAAGPHAHLANAGSPECYLTSIVLLQNDSGHLPQRRPDLQRSVFSFTSASRYGAYERLPKQSSDYAPDHNHS